MTWLRLVENLDRLHRPERVRAWLGTTARREALAVVRRNGREVGHLDEYLDQHPDERFPEPEQHAVGTAMAAVLWSQVGRLPARGAVVVRALAGSDEPTYADLSRRTGIPQGSIGPTRGRQLRAHLERAGLDRYAWH